MYLNNSCTRYHWTIQHNSWTTSVISIIRAFTFGRQSTSIAVVGVSRLEHPGVAVETILWCSEISQLIPCFKNKISFVCHCILRGAQKWGV
jgi:hypothetical protein